LPVGGGSLALASWHGWLLNCKNTSNISSLTGRREESTPTSQKNSFLTVKTQNKIKIKLIKSQTKIKNQITSFETKKKIKKPVQNKNRRHSSKSY
jgi:hypothetical protein